MFAASIIGSGRDIGTIITIPIAEEKATSGFHRFLTILFPFHFVSSKPTKITQNIYDVIRLDNRLI